MTYNANFSGTQCDTSTNAWFTTVAYDLVDNLGQVMTDDVFWNEALAAATCPIGSNWCSVPVQQQNGSTGPIVDRLGPPTFAGVSPVPNCNTPPSGTTTYRTIPQEQRVGSSVTAQGVSVQSDFLGYYIDHGNHDSVVQPPRPLQ